MPGEETDDLVRPQQGRDSCNLVVDGAWVQALFLQNGHGANFAGFILQILQIKKLSHKVQHGVLLIDYKRLIDSGGERGIRTPDRAFDPITV